MKHFFVLVLCLALGVCAVMLGDYLGRVGLR